MPEPNESPAKDPKDPKDPKDQPLLPKQRCRHIKTGGEQCRSAAMTGYHYCWHHRWNRNPHYAGVKGYDRVAFLEDVASVQLILSQAMQGLIDRNLDPLSARSLFYGCQVASGLVRIDMAHQRWLAENKQQPEEPVREATNIDTDPLAPAQEYRGPTGQFEPYWSFSKYMYEQQCEQSGRPKPTSPADMPPGGWMDEEEYFADPAEWTQQYKDKIKAAREQTEAGRKETGAGTRQTETRPHQEVAPPTVGHPEDPERSEGEEEPCAPSDACLDPESSTIDLQATAVPTRCTLNAAVAQ